MKARNNESYISKIKTKHGRTGKAVHASGRVKLYITIQTSVWKLSDKRTEGKKKSSRWYDLT